MNISQLKKMEMGGEKLVFGFDDLERCTLDRNSSIRMYKRIL